MGTRNGNVGYRFVDLEKLKSLACELLTQLRSQLKWKSFLIIYMETHQVTNRGTGLSFLIARNLDGTGAENGVTEVICSKVRIDFILRLKLLILGLLYVSIFRGPTLFIQPLLNNLCVLNNFHSGFVLFKIHPSKAFLM